MSQTTLHIPKMDCPEEVKLIKSQLQSTPGIQLLTFNLIQQELTITHELSDLTGILATLSAMGLEGQIKTSEKKSEKFHTAVSWKDWAVIVMSGFFAILAEIIALSTNTETSYTVIALSVLSMLIGGRQTFKKGIRAIRYLNLNMNFLMSIAIIGAIAIGEWPEAAMVTFLFALAELIEIYSLDKARHAIRGLMELTPDTATVQDEKGNWITKSVSEISVDSTIWVKPGERIPLDGKVTQGQTYINQAPITGESIPVDKKIGDPVFAGTINERGSIEFIVTVNPGDTLLAKIIRAVQQAQAERAPTQRFVDQFAKYYTPIMVLIAIIVAIIPPLILGAAWIPWLTKALVLLVIACPCALVISTPVTMVSGLTAAARNGILIKGGAYLEAGHKLRAIAFDKTGTLTYGKPVVTDILTVSELLSGKVLHIAASLDAHSEHPIAAAIVHEWQKNNLENSLLDVSDFEAIPGYGVTGIINNQRYFLGNHRLAEEKKICSPDVEMQLKNLELEGKTTIVLGTEQGAIAILAVADTIRDATPKAIKSLHQLGITTIMMTGDNATTASAVAQKIGIHDIRANLLPEEKLTAMDTLLRKYEYVGMIGDGINDAPALAKATIGFAMGTTGTDIALETADVALMEDNLTKLPFFIKLSRHTRNKLVENISLSIGIKVVFFILALIGMANLWMAVFADMGASLIVVFNGMRLLRFSTPKE